MGVTPEDLAAASELLATGTAGLCKKEWTKPRLLSAAVALRWFIRELPGGPKLLHRAADLAKSGHGGENLRMIRAAKAVAVQDGVDASLYQPTQAAEDPAATSTQTPMGLSGSGMGLNVSVINCDRGGSGTTGSSWATDISVSQIPPGQGAATGGDGSKEDEAHNCSSSNSDKVSDHSSRSDSRLSCSAPLTLPTDGKGVEGGGNIGAVAKCSGVAQGLDVEDQGTNMKGKQKVPRSMHKILNSTSVWRPRVCNKVWKGGDCPNRNNGCRFTHPTPCSNKRCASRPSNGCRAFHPRLDEGKGNARGDARKGSGVPRRNKSIKPNRPNGYKGNDKPKGNFVYSSNSNSSPVDLQLQLQDRVATVERRLMGLGEKRQGKPSYRDVAARSVFPPSMISSYSGSSSSNNLNHVQNAGGDCALGQPDQAMLSTVVAAVLAVLAGRGQQHF